MLCKAEKFETVLLGAHKTCLVSDIVKAKLVPFLSHFFMQNCPFMKIFCSAFSL